IAHDRPAGELRGADRALTGAAGARLGVRFAAAAGALGAGLGLVRALAGSGQLGHHDLVDQRHVGGDVEDRRRQCGGALLGTVGVEHVDDLVVLGERSHRLHAPFTAVLTTTRPPLGPGTAPETSSRPFSASTAWMVRFWTVWRALPIRPAIRWPRNTRPGVAAPPMEPGLRWLRCAPWEEETPAKPCRFITPAVTLPLEVPTTSTVAPVSRVSAVRSWPRATTAASAVRTSATCRRGVTPAFS